MLQKSSKKEKRKTGNAEKRVETALTSDEIEVVKTVLAASIVNNRTGEIGVFHAGRFVGAGSILKTKQRDLLNAARGKLGMSMLIEYRDK